MKIISGKTRKIILGMLLVMAFVSFTNQTMMITALPVIRDAMKVPLTTVQWLTAGYTLVIGIITPLSSNIYEKFRNRPVFLSIMITFILGTLIGMVAPNFPLLLLGRLIQAIASGILISFQMTVLVSIYPAEKRGQILGLLGLVVSSGPAFGPTIAGVILRYFSWRYLFIFVMPFLIVILLIAYFKFPNFKEGKDMHIDAYSVALSSIGCILTLSSFNVLQKHVMLGIALLIVGLLILTAFVKRQLQITNPVLKVTIFKQRSFRLMCIVCILTFMTLFGSEQMVPIFTEDVLHLSSMQSGLILLPGAVLEAIITAFIGKVYDAYGAKYLILIGGILMLIGGVPLMMLNAQSHVSTIIIAYAIRLIGVGLVFSPAISESFKELSLQSFSHGSALNNSLQQAGGALIVTILVMVDNAAANPVRGMTLAMSITTILVILLIITHGLYIKSMNSQK